MNAVELERIARSTIPPVRATGLCLVVDQEPGGQLGNGAPSGVGGRTRFGPAWIIEDRVKSRPIALFERQDDAHRLLAMLRGEAPAPRSGSQAPPRVDAPPPTVPPVRSESQLEAPDDELPDASLPGPETTVVANPPPSSGIRLCAGCGEPLPADARPNRTAHNAACRERARYRRAAEQARADADGGSPDLTVSEPSSGDRPNDTASAIPARSPDGDAEAQLVLPAPAP